MKRATALLLFLCLSAFLPAGMHAAAPRDDILRIHANILPRTVLMDYRFREKLAGDGILVTVVCRDPDLFAAGRLRTYIREKYLDGLSGLPVQVKITTYDALSAGDDPASIYYFLPASPGQIAEALERIPEQRPVFVYDPADLGNGAMISLRIGRQVRPILNMAALKKADISLRPALVKISELYNPEPHSGGASGKR